MHKKCLKLVHVDRIELIWHNRSYIGNDLTKDLICFFAVHIVVQFFITSGAAFQAFTASL